MLNLQGPLIPVYLFTGIFPPEASEQIPHPMDR